MTIPKIMEQINVENGSNYKLDVLKQHKNNELLQRVLKMTYDRVDFTYGITLKNVSESAIGRFQLPSITLEEALDRIEKNLSTRKMTGGAANVELTDILESVSMDDNLIIRRVINRDQRLNMGRTLINKVWKGLITKPVYMRCGTYDAKSRKKISYPAIVQLKADGTYREFMVSGGNVVCRSRSGEDYEYPVIFEQLSERFEEQVVFGELTIMDEEGNILPRADGNGILNSDDIPHDRVVFDVWDVVSVEDYNRAALKDKKNPNTETYIERFDRLKLILKDLDPKGNIRIIQSHIVRSYKEALAWSSEWMSQGLEGAILKDFGGVFKDGTSQEQLKIKLEMEVEVRILGFKEGKKGSRRESTFGSIEYQTDDQMIHGFCSGFDDNTLKDFNSRREELVGMIMTVRCNDVTQSKGRETWSLYLTRFVEIRNDKDETDTLERALQLKEMAMELS